MSVSAQNQRNVCLGGSKHFGDFSLRERGADTSDFANFVASEKFLETGNEASVDRVLLVAAIIGPFKVCGNRISLVPVDVVDEWLAGWIGDKGQRNKAMDINGFAFGIGPHNDLRIARAIDAISQYLSIASLETELPLSPAINAANAAKVTDFVTSLEISDGHGSPFFTDRGNHAAGLPFGVCDWRIKGPSRGATHGGLAIDNTLPPVHQVTGGIKCL